MIGRRNWRILTSFCNTHSNQNFTKLENCVRNRVHIERYLSQNKDKTFIPKDGENKGMIREKRTSPGVVSYLEEMNAKLKQKDYTGVQKMFGEMESRRLIPNPAIYSAVNSEFGSTGKDERSSKPCSTDEREEYST